MPVRWFSVMVHGGRLLLLALLIGIGLATLGRVVYANSGYVFYIPTSTAPAGHSVPVTIPSGYAFVTSAAQLFYPITQPTTNTTGVSTFTEVYGIGAASSSYDYGTIWNYSNPITYNGWLIGGTVAYNQSAITSSNSLTNFVFVTYFTLTGSTTTSGMNVKMTVSTNGISIYCISSLISSQPAVYTITNSTTNAAAGSGFEVNWGPSNIALSSSYSYVLYYICYATGYVTGVTVNYGSGFVVTPPNLHVDSGYRVDLAYFYFPALVTVSNSISNAWVALQFRNYWTKLQVANATGSSYVYRAVASPSFYSMYLLSNVDIAAYSSLTGSFTVNFIYLNAASGSLNSGTVSNVKAYLGTSSTSLVASSSLGSMGSLTLYTVTGFGEASGNYTLSPPANVTDLASTTLYCYYTVASSGITWNCPSGVSIYNTVYVNNQAGASTLYLAVSETLPGSPASYGYLNSTNPFPSGNVTSFPTSGSYSAYYIAGSTSATAIPIAKGLTVWQTTLPCTLGSALTSVALSENKPSSGSPPVFVQPTINGTALRTWLTGSLTFYTCVPPGDQETFGVTPTQVNTIALQFNGVNQFFQLPQCTISSNPYGGATGTYGLLNCIAIQNGAISAVVWFYLPPGGQGVLLSFQIGQYPNYPSSGWTPWLYIGTNSYLYAGDWVGSLFQVSVPISPGWHIAVVEEWVASTTGPYYLALYLDGSLVGQSSTSHPPQLFGFYVPFPYDDIGTGIGGGYPYTNGGWFFFNGYIALVALYPFVLSSSQVASIGSGSNFKGLPPGYVALYVGNSYVPGSQVWVDASGHGYNAQGYNGPNNIMLYLFNFYSSTYTYTIPSTAHSTTLNVPAYLPYLGQAFYVNSTYTPIYVTLNPYVYGGSTPVASMGSIVVEPSGYASTTITTPLVTSPWSIYLGSMFSSVTVSLPNEWFTNANTGGVGHVSFTIGSGQLGSVFGPLLTAKSNVNVTYVGMWQYSSSLVNNLGTVNFVQPNGALQRVISLTTNYGSFPLNTSGVSIMLVNQTTTVTSITSAGTINTAWYPGVGSYSLTPGATWYLVQATSPYGYVGPPVFKGSLPSIWYIQPSYGSGFTTASNALVKVFNLTSGALLTSANFGSFQYLYLYPNVWGVYINATEIFPNLLPTYNVTGFYMTTVPKSPVNLFVTVTQTAQSQWSGQVLTGLINDYGGNWLWLNGTLYAGIVAGQYSVDTFDVPANLINTPTGFVFYDPGTGSEASLVTNLDPSTYITLGTFGNTLIKTLYTIGYTANAPQPPPLIAPPPNALLSLGETGFGQLVLTGAIAAVGIYIMSRVKSASIGIIIVGALTLGIGALLGAASMLTIGIIMMAGGIAYRYVKGQ